MNLFYDILPYELQHNILIWSFVSEIREKRKLHRHNVLKPIFETHFVKSHGRKLPKWIISNILFTNNLKLYWSIVLDSVNHIQIMNNPILFLKFMKHKTLIDLCLVNKIEIKKNWSKQRLISNLIKI